MASNAEVSGETGITPNRFTRRENRRQTRRTAGDDARQVQRSFQRFLVVQLLASTSCKGVLSGV